MPDMESAIREQLGTASLGDPAAPRVRRQRGAASRAAGSTGNAAPRTASATQGAAAASVGAAPKSSPKSAPRAVRGRNDTQLRNDLAQYISAVSLIPMTFGDVYSAQVIATRAEYLADAYTDLAKQNPKVRKALEAMMSGGAWGGAIVATASVLIPIAGHYRLIPAIDPWAALMPVEAPQQMPAREPQRERSFTGNTDGIVTVAPDMAAAFAATMNDAPTPDYGGMAAFADTLSGMAEPVDRVSSSGAGVEPENYTPPVAPGQPAGVVTVAGVQQRREAVLSQMPEEVTAAPSGRSTDAPPPVPQAPNRRSDIAASAAPSSGDGSVKPRRSRNRATS